MDPKFVDLYVYVFEVIVVALIFFLELLLPGMAEKHRQLEFVLYCIIGMLPMCTMYSFTHRVCRIISKFNYMDLLSMVCTLTTIAAINLEYMKIIWKKRHPILSGFTITLADIVFLCSLVEFGIHTRVIDESAGVGEAENRERRRKGKANVGDGASTSQRSSHGGLKNRLGMFISKMSTFNPMSEVSMAPVTV